MAYTLAIFDMDGTILNTLDDLTASTNYALKTQGLPPRSLEEVRSFVGNGVRLLIQRSVPRDTSAQTVEAVYQSFLSHYALHCADATRPYDGICQAIAALRQAGVKTAVVSNKVDAGVQELCLRYFPGLFDCAVGERPGIAKKPAPGAVNAVLEKLGIPREQAIYIGDSDVDFATAQNARMACISVTWGFRPQEMLQRLGATVFAHRPEELPGLILGK